jgi:hypothetical protein
MLSLTWVRLKFLTKTRAVFLDFSRLLTMLTVKEGKLLSEIHRCNQWLKTLVSRLLSWFDRLSATAPCVALPPGSMQSTTNETSLHHERNPSITVRPEPVEGLIQSKSPKNLGKNCPSPYTSRLLFSGTNNPSSDFAPYLVALCPDYIKMSLPALFFSYLIIWL